MQLNQTIPTPNDKQTLKGKEDCFSDIQDLISNYRSSLTCQTGCTSPGCVPKTLATVQCFVDACSPSQIAEDLAGKLSSLSPESTEKVSEQSWEYILEGANELYRSQIEA